MEGNIKKKVLSVLKFIIFALLFTALLGDAGFAILVTMIYFFLDKRMSKKESSF